MTKPCRVWASMVLVGVQVMEATEDEPASKLELRNCRNCQSTLCIEVGL